MIEHILYFYEEGFSYSWKMELPFRLHKGDEVHNELLDTNGVLLHDAKETPEWMKLCKNEYFEIKSIGINHNGVIEAWLGLPEVKISPPVTVKKRSLMDMKIGDTIIFHRVNRNVKNFKIEVPYKVNRVQVCDTWKKYVHFSFYNDKGHTVSINSDSGGMEIELLNPETDK